MNYYNSSNFIAYRIAENFCEEKLLRNAHLFANGCHAPKFRRENFCKQPQNLKICETFLPKRFPATWYVMQNMYCVCIVVCTHVCYTSPVMYTSSCLCGCFKIPSNLAHPIQALPLQNMEQGIPESRQLTLYFLQDYLQTVVSHQCGTFQERYSP